MVNDSARQRLTVEVDDQFADRVDPDFLRRVLLHTLEAESAGDAAVTVVITDDATVQELNREFLEIDAPTDVLAFPLAEAAGGEPFVLPHGEVPALGEIVISLPTAERQAAEQGISVQDEIGHLLTHGALHLLGYDHIDPHDDAQMRAREEALLAEQGMTIRHGPAAH
jgi:probable rRNA maturation factor